MYLKNLELTNFRNHKKLQLSFQGKIILIYGPNGFGKTNILESIYLLSSGKSLRSQYDSEVVNYSENFLRAKGDFVSDDGDVTCLEVVIDKNNFLGNRSVKNFKVNKVVRQGSKFTGLLKSVIFLPSDLDLLLSSPSIRRRYLDSIFYQTSSEYKKSILDYTKALKQRNKVLELIKENKVSKEQLEFWTNVIISEGTKIQNSRHEFFGFLNENLNSLKGKLNLDSFEISFRYIPNEASYENYLSSQQKEMFTITTQFGPHRDDFEITLNKKNIQYFASRGQQRISLIVLKMIELDFIEKTTNQRPILLLDDIFSELDNNHKNAVIKMISTQQTIITSVYKISEFEEIADNLINIEEIN
jgi:DNA replication and repair protein RecF